MPHTHTLNVDEKKKILKITTTKMNENTRNKNE